MKTKNKHYKKLDFYSIFKFNSLNYFNRINNNLINSLLSSLNVL